MTTPSYLSSMKPWSPKFIIDEPRLVIEVRLYPIILGKYRDNPGTAISRITCRASAARKGHHNPWHIFVMWSCLWQKKVLKSLAMWELHGINSSFCFSEPTPISPCLRRFSILIGTSFRRFKKLHQYYPIHLFLLYRFIISTKSRCEVMDRNLLFWRSQDKTKNASYLTY